jgi:2'-5' RNA ligase superfamily
MTVPDGGALADPPVPQRLTDRWRDRVEPQDGDGLIYWHILLDQAPEIRAGVLAIQRKLAGIPDLHLPPARWLHLTIMTVGPALLLSGARTAALLAAARDRLSGIAPVAVEAEQILFHPEAVVLRVRPARALTVVADAVSDATAETVEGWNPSEHRSDRWLPHVTAAYSTADQPAAPVIAATGHRISVCRSTLGRVSLVEQRGTERSWDWRIAGTVPLSGP